MSAFHLATYQANTAQTTRRPDRGAQRFGNINFFGAIEVDIDAELAQHSPTGYRPLRVRDTLF
ncbi:hypothetical protein [Nocardia sp. R7R-8]|uniref:hypothetical protein n=1 Tax=Nocardia sp. R7R-8 TaxID=3459304 RepID=UPI00403D7CC7